MLKTTKLPNKLVFVDNNYNRLIFEKNNDNVKSVEFDDSGMEFIKSLRKSKDQKLSKF